MGLIVAQYGGFQIRLDCAKSVDFGEHFLSGLRELGANRQLVQQHVRNLHERMRRAECERVELDIVHCEVTRFGLLTCGGGSTCASLRVRMERFIDTVRQVDHRLVQIFDGIIGRIQGRCPRHETRFRLRWDRLRHLRVTFGFLQLR